MNKQVWAGIGVAVLIVGASVFAVAQQVGAPGSSPTPSPSTSISVATITFNGNGFAPATTAVTSGQAVTFTNASDRPVQVDSDPHPAHTDNADLNVGTIAAGASRVVVLSKKGSYVFHNHLDASERGTITIQ